MYVALFFYFYSILCYEIYYILFNHLSIGGYLGYFQSFTNGVRAAIYILIYVFFCTLMAFRVYTLN